MGASSLHPGFIHTRDSHRPEQEEVDVHHRERRPALPGHFGSFQTLGGWVMPSALGRAVITLASVSNAFKSFIWTCTDTPETMLHQPARCTSAQSGSHMS